MASNEGGRGESEFLFLKLVCLCEKSSNSNVFQGPIARRPHDVKDCRNLTDAERFRREVRFLSPNDQNFIKFCFPDCSWCFEKNHSHPESGSRRVQASWSERRDQPTDKAETRMGTKDSRIGRHRLSVTCVSRCFYNGFLTENMHKKS